MKRTLTALGWIVLAVMFYQPLAAAEFESDLIRRRWMVICCGLPGDDPHRERMTDACKKLIAAAEPVFGVPSERLTVLAGDEEMAESLAEMPAQSHDIATRESIQATLAKAADDVEVTDGFWMIVLGHGHLYGSESQLNIQGRDIHQGEFGKWAREITCQEQVFWITQPISGFWIEPLARRGRMIITATEADLEFTGTEMPYALADLVAGEAESQDLEEIDGDGFLSLFDLYLATSIEVAERFRSLQRLQTEHAQLDDNGDGRGSEVQAPYLPEEEPEEEEEEDSDEDEDEDEEDEAEPEDEEESDDGDDASSESESSEDESAEGDDEDSTDEESVGDVETETPEVVVPRERPPLVTSKNLDGFASRFIAIRPPPRPEEPEPDELEATDDPASETAEPSSETDEPSGEEEEESDSADEDDSESEADPSPEDEGESDE